MLIIETILKMTVFNSRSPATLIPQDKTTSYLRNMKRSKVENMLASVKLKGSPN